MNKRAFLTQYLKRTTACLLALILTLPYFAVSAAETYSKEDLDNFNENVRVLSAFDMLGESRQAATTITRGDFAEIMLTYLGYDGMFEGSGFSDISNSKDPAYGMSSLGLMSGYGDGAFHPDDEILSEQAVKVFVSALGYAQAADMNGGYPAGYITYANKLGLLKKASMQGDSALTYYNLVQMMINALTINLAEEDFDGRYSVTDNTWLSVRLDCEKRRGIVTAASGVTLNEGGSDKGNNITIDGVVYDIDGDYGNLIGCYVEFYVNGDNEILYIAEKRTKRMEFGSEDLVSYAEKTYTVEITEGKEEKYKLAQDSYVIFNGMTADKITQEEMCPKYGKITLVDNNSDNRYDIVLIESYEVYVIQSINKTDRKVYYRNSKGSYLDFGDIDEENLTITNSAGRTVDFGKLAVDNVIRTAFSKDGTRAGIIVSTDTISGTVTQLDEDEIYIDNIPYRYVEEQISTSAITVGRTGTFYLDSEGMIAYMAEGDSSYSYGYLLGANIDELEETLWIKILDSMGRKLDLTGASKMKVDGLTSLKSERVLELLRKGQETVSNTVIRYKCNALGEVKEIDTPYNSITNINKQPENGESPDSLRLIYYGNGYYMSQMHNFSGKVNVGADTIFFSVSGENDEDRKVLKVSDIPNETDFMMAAYSDNKNAYYANLLFSSDKAIARGGRELMGVVAKAVKSVNDDNEPVVRISFKSKDLEKDLVIEAEKINPFPYSEAQEAVYDVEAGDIVMLNYNGEDIARSVGLIYKPNKDLFPKGNIYGSAGRERWHYIYGSVYSVEKGYINITQSDIETNGAPSMGDVRSYKLSDFARIYKCTDLGGRQLVEPATADDIIDYQHGGGNCSKVFVSGNWQYPNLLVIYE